MSKNPVPTRMCLACMKRMPKSELIRIVRMTDNKAVIDREHKLAGRGAYICRNIQCIQNAEKKNRFPRALKGDVSPQIYDELKELVSEE